MSGYYFLATSLPDLELNSKPTVAFNELMVLFKENLSTRDWKQVELLRLYYDLINIERLLRNENFDPRANLDVNELRDVILNHEYFPEYVIEFFETFTETPVQLEHFPKMVRDYFFVESKRSSTVGKIIGFDRGLRLILTALRTFKMKADLAHELRYEDGLESDIAKLLAVKDMAALDMNGYRDLIEKLQDLKSPVEEMQALAAFRFAFYSELQYESPFGMPYLLGFMMKLMILEDFEMQNQTAGEHVLNSILKDSA